MDNIAHTLFAGAMARAGASRLHPGATAALLIGANLPDLDIIAALAGPGGYLTHHRGITHSIAGTVAMVPIVAGIVGLAYYGRSGRRRRPREPRRSGPKRFSRLTLAALLGLASHLALDATNAYGVRPLLPFDDTWYYADWLAIIDPWMWFIPGALLYLDTATTRARHLAWILVGTALSVIVLGSGEAAEWVRAGWIAGLVATAFMLWIRRPHWRRLCARLALVLIAMYVTLMITLHSRALDAARTYAPGDHSAAVLPIPGAPGRWRLVYYGRDRVLVGRETVDGRPASGSLASHPLNLDHPAVERATSTPEGAAMMRFARFPFARIDANGAEWEVHLIDARYAWRGDEGWGTTTIRVEPASTPR